jgi:hypothetical protein
MVMRRCHAAAFQTRQELFLSSDFDRQPERSAPHQVHSASSLPGGLRRRRSQMQKGCGIIAIGAIVLSASQFACAQTVPSDQSPPTAGKPELRDEVKDALQQAGFKNIRIISESFLVRALDQNGDPVVMMIRPDSLKTVRAPRPH